MVMCLTERDILFVDLQATSDDTRLIYSTHNLLFIRSTEAQADYREWDFYDVVLIIIFFGIRKSNLHYAEHNGSDDGGGVYMTQIAAHSR